MTAPVMGIDTYTSNAELIEACVRLGYLRQHSAVLDPTYGHGTFWKNWTPDLLLRHDKTPSKAPDGPMLFTALDYPDGRFEAVVFDPPYKLNGTPDPDVDGRYGVDEPSTWQDRHQLIRDGMTECHRVLRPGGYLLLKCMAQVSSGKVRWQDYEFTKHAIETLGMELEDRLDMISYRPQPTANPDGSPRRQVHARRNSSHLLVFKKARR